MIKDKKPREFWLYEPKGTFTDIKIGDETNNSLTHVIEYSAYEILEQKAEQRANSLLDLTAKREALEKKLELAVEALEFIVNREDFSFAECTQAESIYTKTRDTLSKIKGDKK